MKEVVSFFKKEKQREWQVDYYSNHRHQGLKYSIEKMNTMDAPCDLNVNQSNYAQVNRNIDRSNLLKVIRWKPQNLNTIASDS